jgi:hypothetical protein
MLFQSYIVISCRKKPTGSYKVARNVFSTIHNHPSCTLGLCHGGTYQWQIMMQKSGHMEMLLHDSSIKRTMYSKQNIAAFIQQRKLFYISPVLMVVAQY